MITYSKWVSYGTDAAGKCVPVYEPTTVGVGTTAFVRAETEQVMSDVWEQITRIYYFNDAGGLSSVYAGEKDLTHTLDADYDAGLKALWQYTYTNALAGHRARAEENARTPQKGDTVKVVRGRTAKGTVGKIVVMKEMLYNAGWQKRWAWKVAVAVDDAMKDWVSPQGKTYSVYANVVWVWLFNCEVLNPTPNYERAERLAHEDADRAVDQATRFCRQYGALKTVGNDELATA